MWLFLVGPQGLKSPKYGAEAELGNPILWFDPEVSPYGCAGRSGGLDGPGSARPPGLPPSGVGALACRAVEAGPQYLLGLWLLLARGRVAPWSARGWVPGRWCPPGQSPLGREGSEEGLRRSFSAKMALRERKMAPFPSL